MSDKHAQPHGEQAAATSFGAGDSYRLRGWDVARILASGLFIFLEWLGYLPLTEGWSLMGIGIAIFLAWPIFREACESIMERRMTMALSMTIAVVAALALSEVFTAFVITFFVLIAEEIEKFTIFRGKRSVRGLLDLLPQKTFVRKGDHIQEVNLEDVRQGDVVIVKPGARIVVDGVVLSGQSFVDEAAITGEPMPAEKFKGQRVFAGSINQSGALEIQASSVGQDTVFGKIITSLQNAEANRGQVQKFADRLAAYLVYCSFVMAAITFWVTGNLHQTISVIIVSGACGVAAGTPLAIFGAIGRTARSGTIVKGGLYIELLAEVDTVVFDKTGTLTQGSPRVMKVVCADGVKGSELLEAALSAESLSEHPVARAIRELGQTRGLTYSKPVDFRYVAGRGIICTIAAQQVLAGNRALLESHGVSLPAGFASPEGLTEVLVSRGGQFLGGLYIADKLREDAAEAVRELQALGIKTMILSGDTVASVSRVAAQLGINDFAGALTPDRKLEKVKELVAHGKKVAMVGDGINDAPALAAATVGVAVGSGTDVAVESSNVVLIGSGLMKLVDAINIARRCKRIIWANFIGTIAIDVLGMFLAFAGFLSPIIAALIHSGSEVLFLGNSARLLPWFSRRKAK